MNTNSSPAETNSSGVSTPRVRKAVDFNVGVMYSRADLRLDSKDGIVVVVLFFCCTAELQSLVEFGFSSDCCSLEGDFHLGIKFRKHYMYGVQLIRYREYLLRMTIELRLANFYHETIPVGLWLTEVCLCLVLSTSFYNITVKGYPFDKMLCVAER